MARIITFLGQDAVERANVAIALARYAAEQGRRTLLLVQSLTVPTLLGMTLPNQPQAIAANLSVVQLRSTNRLEQGWSLVKEFEQQYLRNPFFKSIYGQELPVLPGMDAINALLALRTYDPDYDVIIYAGSGDLACLRLLGTSEVGSWYRRRLSQAFIDSDLFQTLRPFADPVLRAVANVSTPVEELFRTTDQDWLEQGRRAIADNCLAFLVVTEAPGDVAMARYLWGSAQMVDVTVGGIVSAADVASQFAPLKRQPPSDLAWLLQPSQAPAPSTVDRAGRYVKLFIPGFEKNEIELSQSGPELTITAGDQRRNLAVPSGFGTVTNAKFQDQYLVIQFA